MSLENRITKIERTLENAEEGTFSQYFKELMTLISGRSRGLPSEDKEDPELDAACDRLLERYLNQPSEAGRKRFEDDYRAAMYSVCDCPECTQRLETGVDGRFV